MNNFSDERKYSYIAFISYRGPDSVQARWLKRELISYRLPAALVKESKNIHTRNIKPVFLYQDDNLAGDLPTRIKDAISSSKFLIVICSRHVKEKPYWIDQEINYFLNSGNSPKNIIPLIIEKPPYHTVDVYPPALLALREKEFHEETFNIEGPSFYDIETGKCDRHQAFIRLVASIHGLDTYRIEEQDKRIIRNRRIRQCIATVLALSMLFLSLAVVKAPRVNMYVGGSDSIEANVDDIVPFSIELNNLSRKDSVIIQINMEEGIIVNDYCQIHSQNGNSSKLPVDIFAYEDDISTYITDDHMTLTFDATITDDGLKLGENQLYAHVIVKTSSNKLDDTVVVSVTPSGSDISEDIDWGWGDNEGGRDDVTLQEYNDGKYDDIITFNRISDGVIGHEFNFVAAREYSEINDGKFISPWRGNEIEVKDGKTYIIRMYVHNLCALEEDNIAEDVRCWFKIPDSSGSQLLVNGIFESSNASPSTYWDSVVFISDHEFILEYVEGSALLENNVYDSYNLPDTIIEKDGAVIGYDKMDGKIPGGFQSSCVVTIKVKARPAE